MTDNPYQAPRSPVSTDSHLWSDQRPNRLRIPAIIMLVLACVQLLLLVEFVSLDVTNPRFNNSAEALMWRVIVPVIWALLMVVVIVGSVGMLRLKGYRCAVAASIISCIPGVLLPCFVLSTPCGICALVLLLQSDVKARFSEHQD